MALIDIAVLNYGTDEVYLYHNVPYEDTDDIEAFLIKEHGKLDNIHWLVSDNNNIHVKEIDCNNK